MDELINGVVRAKLKLIICGDMNAPVGARNEQDDQSIIGQQGFGNRNGRGEILLRWSSFHNLVITNTFFSTPPQDNWTWAKGVNKKQLDYILVDKALFSKVGDCTVLKDLDASSDHRAVLAHLRLTIRTVPNT